VTHEIGFARKVADRVVFMERGEILEEGPSDALFAAPRNERRVRFLPQVLGH
jgi:ABC-type polar amino acid transport system ATPase subunit